MIPTQYAHLFGDIEILENFSITIPVSAIAVEN